jgi:hypothetical protein
MMVVGNVVVAFIIFIEWYVLKISWLNAIKPFLFLACFYHKIVLIIIPSNDILLYVFVSMCAMTNLGGMVASIVVTIVNGCMNKFDKFTPLL